MSRDRQIAEQIRQMRYKIDGDHVYLGLSPTLPNLLSLSPEDYGHLQSLVLEMVVPVNPDYLEENNFKSFLEKSDLLDFPGVGNETNSKFTKVDLGFGNTPQLGEGAPAELPAENRFPKYNPRLLFTRIIKRGKTATIVSLYARKLKIDGFNIFLALDRNPPANPGQLLEGINTWWKYAVPNFYRGGRTTKSPLPLNLVLLWWADLINASNPTSANFMEKVKWIYSQLGEISNPSVSSFYALNYYRIDYRGGVRDLSKLKRDGFFVRGITGEGEFKRVFGEGEAQRRAFVLPHGGGQGHRRRGTLFQRTLPPIGKTRAAPRPDPRGRGGVVEGKTARACFLAKDLFPEPEERDVRREILEAMKVEIFESIDKSDERAMARINHLMREFLNIDFRALKPVPMFAHEVNTDFIRSQYASWITSQCNRVEAWRKSGRKENPDWTIFGLDAREKMRSWLEALVASLEAQLLPTARWLKDLVEYNTGRPGTDLRRVLAIRMGNALVYGAGRPAFLRLRRGRQRRRSTTSRWTRRASRSRAARAPVTACFSSPSSNASWSAS